MCLGAHSLMVIYFNATLVCDWCFFLCFPQKWFRISLGKNSPKIYRILKVSKNEYFEINKNAFDFFFLVPLSWMEPETATKPWPEFIAHFFFSLTFDALMKSQQWLTQRLFVSHFGNKLNQFDEPCGYWSAREETPTNSQGCQASFEGLLTRLGD